MPRGSQNLAAMTVDALLKLRDDIGSVLSEKAHELKQQLSRLGDGDWRSSGPRVKTRTSAMKGRKVAPKYRGPENQLWAGRGAKPRWLQAAIKEGAKQEDFLIAKGPRKVARKSRKRKAA